MSHRARWIVALIIFVLVRLVVNAAIYYQRALGDSEYIKAAMVVFWVLSLIVGAYLVVLDLQKQPEERDRRK